MIRKILGAFLITAGLAALSAPFFYRFYGECRTRGLMEELVQEMGREGPGMGENVEKREVEDTEEPASPGDTELFPAGDAIGMVEIEALGITYPVVEGADSGQLAYGIGHIPGTAAIGGRGNCVLAGHRGSRYGTYFKHLDRLAAGDLVTVMDKEGKAYRYEAVSWEVVGPYDSSVKAQGEGRELTLLTCEGSGTMRLVYHCIYREEE